jgi:RNA polymerase sigma-70 factor (ECF subfamily)
MDTGSTSLSLLEQAVNRDEGAWERLVRIYQPLVTWWYRRAGLRPEDLPDLTQDVFQAVAVNLAQFETDRGRGAFRRWLRGITRFKVLDHFRQRHGKPGGEGGSDAYRGLTELSDPLSLAHEDDSESELSCLYHRALELIRRDFQERTWMAFWRTGVEREPVSSVATELGMTALAVRQARTRVLRRLKKELAAVPD